MKPVARPAALSAAVLALLVALTGAPARADDIQDINRLIKQGQNSQALDRVNQYLAKKPRDAQGRFLKGVILTEQNKPQEAIDIFTKLSQDYPELPEPYNNLAVLYASQGQYEKARQSLEMSIRTHPAYATAYENLGDVYTKLASQSYDKALQLDNSNATAKSKLALMTEIISSSGRPAKPATAAAPVPAQPPARTADAGKITPTPAPPPVVAQAPAKAEPKPAPAPKAEGAGDAAGDEVLKSVQGWARAWAAKDVPAYLSY